MSLISRLTGNKINKGVQWISVAHLHHNKKIHKARTYYKKWQYPEPASHNDLWRKKRCEDASINWAKPMLEYKQKKAEESSEPKESHMIHVVTRIRPDRICWWEREILNELGLDQSWKPVPLKNTPTINAKLREVKHLLHIRPLTFPHGEPQNESDFAHCELRPDGRLLVTQRLEEAVEGSPALTAKPYQDRISAPEFKNQINERTWKKELHRQRQNYELYAEYFKADYKYEKNQDGKEHRYSYYGYDN